MDAYCARNFNGIGCHNIISGLPCDCNTNPFGGGGEPSGGYGGGSGGGGAVTINQGGATTSAGTYSQTLAAILSGLAILHNQPYVPTSIQPAQQPIYLPNTGIGYGVAGYGDTGRTNAFGGIQQYIQQHPMAILIGVGAIALIMMRPPMVRRNGLKKLFK